MTDPTAQRLRQAIDAWRHTGGTEQTAQLNAEIGRIFAELEELRRANDSFVMAELRPRAQEPVAFDLVAHLHRQVAFSERTFGPGKRTEGVVDHIAKELAEVLESGGALSEWVDVIILALDGAWRSGATPQQIVEAIVAKQTKNEGRTWPDWRTVPAGKAIEHDRTHDAQQPTAICQGCDGIGSLQFCGGVDCPRCGGTGLADEGEAA